MFKHLIDKMNCDHRHSHGDVPLISGTVDHWIFLAAYMFALMDPKVIFGDEEVGPLELRLVTTAPSMLDAFYGTVRALSNGTPWSEVSTDAAKELPNSLCEYLNAFKDYFNNNPRGANMVNGWREGHGLCESSRGITNNQLNHELLLDPNFQLGKRENGVCTDIKRPLNDSFWDFLLKSMSSQHTEDLATSPIVYPTVRKVMCEILRYSVTNAIEEAANEILLQTHNCCLDDRACVNLAWVIADTYACEETTQKCTEVCNALANATGGDNSVRAQAICAILKFVMDCLHTENVRQVNAKLKDIALKVNVDGVSYERGHFDQDVINGKVDLVNTQYHIKRAVEEIRKVSSIPLDAIPGNSDYSEMVVNMMFISAILGSKIDEIPETLRLDRVRFVFYIATFRRHVISDVIFSTVMQYLHEAISNSEERSEISENVEKIVFKDSPTFVATDTITQVMEELEPKMSILQRSTLRGDLNMNVKEDSPCYMNAADYWGGILYNLVRGDDISCQGRHPVFARVLLPKVKEYLSSIMHVAALNKRVHRERYEEMIIKTAGEIYNEPMPRAC